MKLCQCGEVYALGDKDKYCSKCGRIIVDNHPKCLICKFRFYGLPEFCPSCGTKQSFSDWDRKFDKTGLQVFGGG